MRKIIYPLLLLAGLAYGCSQIPKSKEGTQLYSTCEQIGAEADSIKAELDRTTLPRERNRLEGQLKSNEALLKRRGCKEE